MSRLRAPAVILVLAVVSAAISACTSSSSTSSKPAVCTSVQQLKASVTKLTQLDLGANALDTLRTDLTAVKQNLKTVSRDASSHYSSDVAKLRADATQVQTAVTAAKNNPSASAFAAIGTAVKSLSSGVTALANKVASTC